MSITDPQADPVQPEGQGGEGTGDSPYSEYLNRINDPEARTVAEEAFKAWDANVTQRFQQTSEQQKQWEPYQQLGVNQYDPEFVQYGLQLAQAAQQDPQGFVDWTTKQFAQEHGITLAEAQAAQQQQQFDEFGNPVVEQPNVEALLQQQLQPIQQQLQQFQSWQQQQEQQRIESQTQQALDQRMQELADQHGEAFNKQAVEQMAWKYATPGSDPRQVIDQGWADYQAIVNQVERNALQAKADAPNPPEGGGGVPNAANEPPSFQDAGRQAAEMIRQMNRS